MSQRSGRNWAEINPLTFADPIEPFLLGFCSGTTTGRRQASSLVIVVVMLKVGLTDGHDDDCEWLGEKYDPVDGLYSSPNHRHLLCCDMNANREFVWDTKRMFVEAQ
jgi:hypothetical protein